MLYPNLKHLVSHSETLCRYGDCLPWFFSPWTTLHFCMTKITTDEQLTDLLITPSEADVDFARRLQGDTVILGAGGKMGPTLALRLRLALAKAGKNLRVLAVSRFESSGARAEFEATGVETMAADLLDPAVVRTLPQAENVLYLAGRKFGSTGDPELTWAMNALVPAWVAEHYRNSRIVAFSTGNVYPFVSAGQGGSVESDLPAPRGEYAQSCLARERVFQYYSKKFNTPCLIYRLNYAIDLRYGVLVDIARQVFDDQPVRCLGAGCECAVAGRRQLLCPAFSRSLRVPCSHSERNRPGDDFRCTRRGVLCRPLRP